MTSDYGRVTEKANGFTECPILAEGRLGGGNRYVTAAFAVEQLSHHLPATQYPSRLSVLLALIAGRKLQTPGIVFTWVG